MLGSAKEFAWEDVSQYFPSQPTRFLNIVSFSAGRASS
jgi:hypothetical protein